jgi:hypothetical protein
MSKRVYVELITPDITIDNRTYPSRSVVEVDHRVRKRLVERGHAADHAGPAFEPEAVEGPEPPATRNRKPEKATRI